MSYISFKDVTFEYPDGCVALDNISLDIEQGERLAIIGHNGAGKTTAVKLINGLCKPSRGVVTVGGMDTRGFTTAQLSRVAGYVFQNPDDAIFTPSVISEVGFGPRVFEFDKDKTKRLVDFALEITGLDGFRETNPYDLPLSTRKFMTIALVIAADSPIMIFDEPTAGQDLAGEQRLARILDELHGQGKTVITITHDMEFVAESFNRVIVMADKRIVTSGSPRDIFWDFDALDKAMLKPPYVSRLCRKLGIGGNLIHMQEAAEAIAKEIGFNKLK